MNYDEDPTRWTSSPDDAPELLRGAFTAARDEGPSRTQMRSLALKIAAASAGGAVAVGTVKAASAGQAIAAAATWSVGKIATVVALAGTLVTGGALVWHANTRTNEVAHGETGAANSAPEGAGGASAAARATAESGKQADGASVALGHDKPVVQELGATSASAREREPAPRVSAAPSSSSPAANAGVSKTLGARNKASSTAANEKPAASAPRTLQHARTEASATGARASNVLLARDDAAAKSRVKANAPQSEITLLRRAQLALQARPREAFQLTQEHRRLYPNGEFAQERDALAIQALMRVGDSENARDLATSFIRAYPSSPHAHRFREAMGLH